MTCCSTFDGYIWHLLICLISHWSPYLQKARFFASIKKRQISGPSDHCVFCGLTNPFFSKCHTNNPDIQQCDIYLCLFMKWHQSYYECWFWMYVVCNCISSISEKWWLSVIKSDFETISWYILLFKGSFIIYVGSLGILSPMSTSSR